MQESLLLSHFIHVAYHLSFKCAHFDKSTNEFGDSDKRSEGHVKSKKL